MDSSNSYSEELLVTLANAQVFRLIQNDRLKLQEGQLRIMHSVNNTTNEQAFYLQVSSFVYTLQKVIPFIVKEYETHTTLIFPHADQSFTGLVLLKASENLDAVMGVLGNLVTLQTYEVAI